MKTITLQATVSKTNQSQLKEIEFDCYCFEETAFFLIQKKDEEIVNKLLDKFYDEWMEIDTDETLLDFMVMEIKKSTYIKYLYAKKWTDYL